MSVFRRNAPTSLNIQELHETIDHIGDYNQKIYQAALWYAKNGLMIVPFMDYGYPKGLSQHGASKSISKIEEWWNPDGGKYPGAAIAMAHGGQSGYCALDLDVKGDIDGISTLADLLYTYGTYNDGSADDVNTLMATTPSGGRHLVFRYNPEIISNSEVHFAGVDTRGGLKKDPAKNGGITFVEPSKKPKGDPSHVYRWDINGSTDIIDMPQWLVEVLNGRKPQNTAIALQDAYIESAPGVHGDGRDRNIYIDLLRFVGAGYTEQELWELKPQILKRMDPPDEEMVNRKIESAIQSDAFLGGKKEKERREKTDSLELTKSEKGNVLRTASNLKTIVRSPLFAHEYGEFEYDEFYHHFVRNKNPVAIMGDYAYAIVEWISENMRLEYSSDMVRKAIEGWAYSDKQYANAAREYIAQCPPRDPEYKVDEDFWGSKRKGPGPAFYRLCHEVLDLSNPKLHDGYDDFKQKVYEAQLWFWLQGVCARACVPGCKMEMVLNIFGDQGIGKSTFFAELLPDPTWFTDSIKDAVVDASDNKDQLAALHGKLIAEMPELSPIKKQGKASDDRFKQFISTQVDRFRPSHRQDVVEFRRTCALAGTSNNRDVYRDMTGDRRFLSLDHGSTHIKLGDISNGVMDEIRNQLWGELRDSFRDGELRRNRDPHSLLVCVPVKLRQHQKDINSLHRYEEVGKHEIEQWVKDKTRITYAEIVEFVREKVSGLKDEKERNIIRLARDILSNKDGFEQKKTCHRKNINGEKERTSFWINYHHPAEQTVSTDGIPDHWSKQTEADEEY